MCNGKYEGFLVVQKKNFSFGVLPESHPMKHFFIAALLLLAANVFAQDTAYSSKGEDSVYITVEVMPEFPGGENKLFRFLAQNIKYPAYALENGISGVVYVRFIVEEDGTLNNIDVIKSPHKSLSEEALRVVQHMPKWKPAMQEGKAVKVRFNLPINFVLK